MGPMIFQTPKWWFDCLYNTLAQDFAAMLPKPGGVSSGGFGSKKGTKSDMVIPITN